MEIYTHEYVSLSVTHKRTTPEGICRTLHSLVLALSKHFTILGHRYFRMLNQIIEGFHIQKYLPEFSARDVRNQVSGVYDIHSFSVIYTAFEEQGKTQPFPVVKPSKDARDNSRTWQRKRSQNGNKSYIIPMAILYNKYCLLGHPEHYFFTSVLIFQK